MNMAGAAPNQAEAVASGRRGAPADAAAPFLLALDGRLLAEGLDPGALEGWPGLRLLAALPGHGIGRDRLRALEERMHVVEFLEAPGCMARLLASLARLGRKIAGRPPEAFLWLGRAPAPGEIEALAEVARARPSEILFEGSAGEGTRLMLLGPGVLRHPLLPTFMNAVADWHVEDRLFCDLLRRTLLEARP